MLKEQVTIIGAGTMGSGIAQLLASGNINVNLVDRDDRILKQAKEKIGGQLQFLHDQSFIEEDAEQILSRICLTEDIAISKDSWLIIEAVPENIQLKHKIFSQLESICDTNVIFATNTSGIPVSVICKGLNNPERLVGMHFFMPAHIIPLVEVIKGTQTTMPVIERVFEFLKKIDKYPVLIHKEVPGFIGNRIQHAIAREAISLLAKGVASAEDIDFVVRYSLGVRLLFTGPLEQRDWNGLDVHLNIASYLYEDLENRTKPSQLLEEKVAKGHLGVKTNQGFYDWEGTDIPSTNLKKNIQLLELMKWLKEKETKGSENHGKSHPFFH